MALSKQVIDIFLSTLNQVPGKHSGPIGRLTNLVDCIVRKYIGPGQEGERCVVEARNAFQALSSASRNVQDGTSAALGWANPQLLNKLGNQLVSVCNDVPRVYADSDSNWSGYPDVRVLLDKLTQDIYHTSDHTIQVPDGAQVGDSTGCVWTETSYTQSGDPIGSTWFGIKSKLGTWVTTPRQLYAPNDTTIKTMAKVVSDGARFWVFWNDIQTGVKRVNVAAYSEQGALLDTDVIAQVWQDTPGYWDVTYRAGCVLLAQPAGSSPPTDVFVKLTKFTFGSGVISQVSHLDNTMQCNGGVAWITNDADLAGAYLATVAEGTPSDHFKLYAYRILPGTALSQVHEYDCAANLPYFPDAVTGWTVDVGGGNYDVYVTYGLPSLTGRVHGPVYDPALRNVNTIHVPFGSTGTLVRTTQSVCLVSRAFNRNGSYYAYTYYQSGSGLVITQAPLSVSITDGDYMVGNGDQPIQVQTGDYTTGGQLHGHSNNFTDITGNQGSQSITAADTVALYTVIAGDELNTGGAALPVGTQVLKWTFANLTGSSGAGYGMSSLSCAGASISGSNHTFLIIPASPACATHVFYTKKASFDGSTPVPGTFTATGSVVVTSNVLYPYSNLSDLVSASTAFMYVGGSLTIAGSSGTGNNGTFLTTLVMLDTSIDVNDATWAVPSFGPCLMVTKSTQTLMPSTGFDFGFSPEFPYAWSFSKLNADASDIGCNLVVDGAVANNTGSFVVSGTNGTLFLTAGTDASGTVAQVFTDPVPTVSVGLSLAQTPYMFYLQSVTTDYTYLNAYLQLSGSRKPGGVNNGVYQITWLDPANTHKFVAVPLNGKTNQVNESFIADEPATIIIQRQTGVTTEYQPIWFITPLDGKQPQVGAFERGIAYADWRFEGQTPNLYPLGLSTPFVSDSHPSIILPYRAKSFTAGETVTTPTGTSTSIVTDTLESTIGLKRFRLDTTEGQAIEAFNELIMPGPLGGGFTSSGFHEQGINLGPEAPFVVAEENDTSAFGITAGNLIYQVVYEWMDDNGERGYSYPSPALSVFLQAPNNTVTIGGRLPLPLDSNGQATVANTYGITNRTLVGISIYRTATVNGIPSVQRFKVTNDLNVNGLYDGGGGAGSGFAFPDTYTWYYRDQALDAAIVDQEALYTTKGLLPRYPAPPFSQGDVWENRTWLVGYDSAVWCSGDKQEGDGNWFFPGFKVTLSGDVPVAVQKMEQYLVIGGQSRMWYLPAQNFPNSTGTNGSFPLAAPLPFPNGCTGFMATSHIGTVYSGTAGGVWCVTRDLKNAWLSEAIKDDLGTVNGIAVDQNQRIAVSDGSTTLYVYDPVPQCWYKWAMPSIVQRLGSWQGNFVYQDTAGVLQQVPGQYLDTYSGGQHSIAPDITLAGLNFSSVRAVQRVWELQIVGEYKGPHKLNAVLSYPDDTGYQPTTFGPYAPSSTAPYLIAVNPANEEAGQFGLRIFASFEGIGTPGNSFSLELISAECGVDRKQGLNKLPTGQRIRSS